MAVTKGNVSSGAANNANIDFIHTLNASSTVLVVGACLDSTNSVNSVTWDLSGVAETFTSLRVDDNVGDAHTEIWYLLNPSTAFDDGTIRIATTTKFQNIGGCVGFLGAGTPDNQTGSVPDTVTSVSDTVTGDTADNFIFDCIRSPGGALTEGANQTADWNLAGGGEQGAGSTQDGTDGGVMSWSWTGNANVAHSACRIPESGAVAGHPPLIRIPRHAVTRASFY